MKADVVDLLEVRPEVVRSRPVLGLLQASSVMAAISRPALTVHTLQMPLKVIGGAERLRSLRTFRFGASVWFLVPRDMLSMGARIVSSRPVS